MDETLVMFTDGGARGNPGPAGIGVVFYKEDEQGNRQHLENLNRFIGETTNNFAEYTALIEGLEEALAKGHKRVKVYMDSELVVKQLNGLYKVREATLQPLATKVLALTNKFENVTFTHVHREKNSEADKLVNFAIDAATKNK